MNPFSIFTNKNDLVKVLAIGGLLVLILSLVYPIEKTKDLDLKRVELNSEIRNLKSKIQEADKLLKELESRKNSTPSKTIDYKVQIRQIRSEIVFSNNTVKSTQDELVVLKKYIHEYQTYTNLFFWTGLTSSVLGVLLWGISGYVEFKNNKKKNEGTPTADDSEG